MARGCKAIADSGFRTQDYGIASGAAVILNPES